VSLGACGCISKKGAGGLLRAVEPSINHKGRGGGGRTDRWGHKGGGTGCGRKVSLWGTFENLAGNARRAADSKQPTKTPQKRIKKRRC